MRCPVDVGIEVNLFLFEFNWTIVSYKPTATEVLSPSIGLDLEAKSRIPRQAGDSEKRLILVGVQTDATGQVTAMVIARIEQKPEGLCAGDEFEEVGFVVKKDLRSFRHLKDQRTKMGHLFISVLGGPAVPIASVWPTGQPHMRLVCTSPMPYDTYEVRQQRYSN